MSSNIIPEQVVVFLRDYTTNEKYAEVRQNLRLLNRMFNEKTPPARKRRKRNAWGVVDEHGVNVFETWEKAA